MQMLLKGGTVIDPTSPYHLQTVDIHIEGGRIADMGKSLPTDAAIHVVDITGMHVSNGWIDLEAEVGEPGQEHREDIAAIAAAAQLGGFTHVGVRPMQGASVQDKSGVSYLLEKGRRHGVSLLPIGAVSHDLAGKDISEMLDMRAAGAVAFSDGTLGIQHAGMMQRALLYVKTFNGLVMNQPADATLSGHGQIHEGEVSTLLGMPGIPAIAEELMVARDLQLLAYTDSRLHLSHLSTAGAVAQVRAAKAAGLRVTASVAALNLVLTVDALQTFNSHLKVLPPLRSEADRQALIEGLRDGTIDCVASNHTPREVEAKSLEFPYADFGAAMMETAFAAAATALRDTLSEAEVIALFTTGPRRVLGLPAASIAQHAPADLTIYDYNEVWTPQWADTRSKSRNNPLVGQSLTGRARMVVKGGGFKM